MTNDFNNRAEAGRLLALKLNASVTEDAIVVALPRGGVPVGAEIAQYFSLPLDIYVVRKVTAPWQPEFSIGSIGEDGQQIIDQQSVRLLGVSKSELQKLVNDKRAELIERTEKFRRVRPALSLQNKTVILVDDGIATGNTVMTSIRFLRNKAIKKLILAVPVLPQDKISVFRKLTDELVYLHASENFVAVGQFYKDFGQVSDAEVLRVLLKYEHENSRSATGEQGARLEKTGSVDVVVSDGLIHLPGRLDIPDTVHGTILFAHGSGSGHLSERNRRVAKRLNQSGFATLLFDLLTKGETFDRSNVFDIELLGDRLKMATNWLKQIPTFRRVPIGYFGASTGAAAAVVAAADASQGVRCIVSRGGRPDLAYQYLDQVQIPVLLIVGSEDHEVLALNRKALVQLPQGELSLVSGATHLFEEPGALEMVARLAQNWFTENLANKTVRHDFSGDLNTTG